MRNVISTLSSTFFGIVMIATVATSFTPSASASLIGDSVDASFTGGQAFISPGTAVVGAGNEFEVILVSNTLLTIDVADASIAITSNARFPFGTDTLVISDLDWVGDPGRIVGVSLDLSSDQIRGFELGKISFTDDSVTVDFTSIFFGSAGLTATINLEVDHGAIAVSEPFGIALLGLGLLGLGVARRHKAFK